MTDLTSTAQVLLVDDNATFLYALQEALRVRMNWIQVETCNSAKTALQRIETIDYDAIVTDIKMPEIDGLELLVSIRSRRPDTPVLLVTGYGDYPTAVQALRGGAYDILQKPIDWEYFTTSLSSAIKTQQINRARSNILQQTTRFEPETLLSGVKVLIVEDDRDGRELQRVTFQAHGAEVVAVSSVQAALNIFEAFDPDILVSDIRMPDEDGYSLIRKVRRRSTAHGGQVPAVAVTAYSEAENRAQALRAGFQLQLAKPIDVAKLVLTVASLVGKN